MCKQIYMHRPALHCPIESSRNGDGDRETQSLFAPNHAPARLPYPTLAIFLAVATQCKPKERLSQSTVQCAAETLKGQPAVRQSPATQVFSGCPAEDIRLQSFRKGRQETFASSHRPDVAAKDRQVVRRGKQWA